MDWINRKYKPKITIDLKELLRDIKKGLESEFQDMDDKTIEAFARIALSADIGPYYTSQEHKEKAIYNELRDYGIKMASERIEKALRKDNKNI